MSKSYEALEQRAGNTAAEVMVRYMDEILRMNESINLTAVKSPDEFVVKHLLDSLSCIDSPEWKKALTIADIGTGAGFPGVPLAIMDPSKKFSLIDSLQKRLRVIDQITEELNISNIQTFHLRAEEAGQSKEHREKYDLCVSRAVASMNVLVEWCLPLLKVGGTFIAYKGEKVSQELSEAENAIRLLGGKVNRLEKVSLQDRSAENHVLVYIEKVKHTPNRFPRKSGTAKKEPL